MPNNQNSQEAPAKPKRTRLSRSRRGRKLLFKALTVAFGIGLGLAACEVFLRLFVEQETKRLAVYDPELGWRGRPFGTGTYIRSADNIRTDFRYNNLGYRDNDVLPKQPGQRRVMLIGDSFIENLEVDFSQTFPALVESELQSRSENWQTCVIGSQGYSTAQELKAFRRYEPVIDPDIALLFVYCGNDFEDNMRTAFSQLREDGEIEIKNSTEPAWKVTLKKAQRWLYESSHVVFLLKNKLQSIAHIELSPTSKESAAGDEALKREVTGKLIRLMAREVKEQGIAFGVIIIPFRDDLANDIHERPQFVAQVCEKAGIDFIDLTPALSEDLFFETDVHFTVEGHRIVSEQVMTLLEQQLDSSAKSVDPASELALAEESDG